jgi:hypothetical protein
MTLLNTFLKPSLIKFVAKLIITNLLFNSTLFL